MAFMNIGAHPDKLIIYTKSRSKLRGIRPEEIDKLLSRRPHNVAVVAVANKMARTIWALLVRDTEYDANHAAIKAAA
jgi:hypothetical protein